MSNGLWGSVTVRLPHWDRSQFATARGSKRTHVPMRNEGMRPALACLKIVIRETANSSANSLAVSPSVRSDPRGTTSRFDSNRIRDASLWPHADTQREGSARRRADKLEWCTSRNGENARQHPPTFLGITPAVRKRRERVETLLNRRKPMNRASRFLTDIGRNRKFL